MSTALLQVRVDEELKHRVDKKLKRMGLTTSSAVNLLLHQIDIQGRFPSRLSTSPMIYIMQSRISRQASD